MSPRRAAPVKQTTGGLPSWLIVAVVAIVVIVVVIVGADFVGKMTASPTPAPSGLGSRTRGSPNARIEFVEYSDFK